MNDSSQAQPPAVPDPSWRSDKAHEVICDAAERIANAYCSEDDTYSLEVRRLTVAISEAVDHADLPRAAADDGARKRAREIIGDVNNYAEESTGELSISAFGPLAERLAAALSTARVETRLAVEAWQPIETAPVNEQILVTYPSADGDEEIHIATLSDYVIPGSTRQWLSASWAAVGSGAHVLPTRWHRLPSLTGPMALPVEAAANEIRELWPNCSFQIREENNAGFYKPFQRHFEIGVISTGFDVHGERFEVATLDEAMQKVPRLGQDPRREGRREPCQHFLIPITSHRDRCGWCRELLTKTSSVKVLGFMSLAGPPKADIVRSRIAK